MLRQRKSKSKKHPLFMARFPSKIARRLLSLQPVQVYLFFPGNISFLAADPSFLLGGGMSEDQRFLRQACWMRRAVA